MSRRQELAAKRAMLVARSELQRRDLALSTGDIAHSLRKVDAAVGVARRAATHPLLLTGAVAAVVTRRKSLLPAGITSIDGAFVAGDPVDLLDENGHIVARGLVNFDAQELPGLLGRSTRELARELGQLGLSLREGGQVWQPLADPDRGGLGGAARREQAEGAPLGGIDELGDLVELGLTEPVAAGRGQVLGDIEDRLLAVVERRPDVDAPPGDPVGVRLR